MSTASIQDPPCRLVVFRPRNGQGIVSALIEEASALHRQEHSQESLRWLIAHPEAPEEWLLELCERGECLDDLGHRLGPRKLLEAMAERHHYPEAILTLGKTLYGNRIEPAERLRTFLNEHRDRNWLFETLARETPDPPEKEQVLREVVAPLPVRQPVEQLLEGRRQERLAAAATDPREIERLYQLDQPRIWRALAANPHTPRAILQSLREVKGVAFSREIRTVAASNLARRGEA